MFERINRQRKQAFKKKHFVRIIRNVVNYCTRDFGYKKTPYIFETQNDPNLLMLIRRSPYRKGVYGIFYDYNLFKKTYGHLNFGVQYAYAILLMAHEMRHYYQMRQIDSKKPWEDAELLEEWRKDDESPMPEITSATEEFEHFKRPMEIDAELFAYCFVADSARILVSTDYLSGYDCRGELEKHYIRLFGKTNETLFPKEK